MSSWHRSPGEGAVAASRSACTVRNRRFRKRNGHLAFALCACYGLARRPQANTEKGHGE